MQDNEIYKFMKANGLTDKDEKTFLNEYSNPKKAKEVFNFFKANELTDKDETSFYDTYLKKKEPITSSVTPSQLPKISEQVSPLQQGANIVGGGVIGDISKAVPKEGTKKENDYFKQIAVGIKPSAQGDVVERIYENPMGVEVLQVEPKKREAAPQQPVQKAESKDKPLKGVKPIAPTKTELNEQGWLLNMVSAIDKGIYKTLGTTAQGAGTLLQGVTSKITGGTGEGFISDALIKFGDSYNKMIDELTPQDESFKGSLSDQVGQALGFVGGLALTGGASSVARGSSALMQQAPKSGALTSAVKELVKGTVSPTGVVGGLTMGQAEFDRAKQSGATDEQAFEAFYKNAAVGSVLERIPVMHFLKRFNQSTAGGVVNYIKTKGVAGLTGGVEEMTTEMLQQLYANKTAKDIYNTNQDLFEGVAGNSGIGFSVGFLLNAMGANAKILRKQGKVNEAKLVENQVKELQEKAKGVAPTNNAITTKIAVNGNEEGLQRTQAELDNDLQKGLISEEEYQEKALVAQKAAEVNAKIPDYVQGVNRAESIDLINERENLQQELAQKEEQKKSIDVAYHKSIDESNKEVQKRIDEINSQLGELAKPEKNIIKPNVRTESLEYGGSKYYITDNSGNEIGSAEVSTVDDKIIIDNLFVDEKNKRKGLATSILDKIIEDFKGRNYEYIDQNDVEFSIPYKIEVGTVVSEEGQAFSNSVRKKIEEFNKNQEKGVLPKEEVIVEEEIQQPIEQPQGEVVEAVRVEQEPEAKEGVKVVTLSGMVEGDRVKAVEERKKKTTLTEKETLHNDLIDLANRVQKSRGNEKTNLQGQIRQRVRELNANLGEEVYKYDGVSVRTKVKSKTKGERYLKIKGTTRDTSGRAIKEDAVLLFDRSPEFVQKYEQLADSPNITALQVDSGNGVTMTAEQIEAALQDIADGIPSVQADNLLNALEEGFNRGYFDLRGKDIGQDRVQATVEDFIGVQQEEVGQPLDEEAMFEWLNEISELPQEEQIEIDNIILEYEQQPQQIDISGKIQSPKPESKEGSPTSTKPSKEGEGNGKPKTEVSKQPIAEAKPKQEDVEEKIPLEKDDQTPPPPTPPTKKEDKQDGDAERFDIKSILNRIANSTNISEEVRNKFKSNLKYKVSSQAQAREVAKQIISEFGYKDALAMAEMGRFEGDVNSLIFAESLDNAFDKESKATTPEEKAKFAEEWKDIAIRYDEAARDKGRFISAIQDFYKKSPLGIVMVEESKRGEQFRDWFSGREKPFKEVFEELVKEPEFEQLLDEKVKDTLKKERGENRAKRRTKIENFFDSVKFKGDALYAVPIPPKVINAALDLMKNSFLAGESVVNAVEVAIDYITKEVGQWDKEKFRKEYQEKLQGLDGGKTTKTEQELTEEKKEKILDKFRKKLKGLSESQKEEVIRKSFKRLVENGALEYEDFKDIIADVLGYGKMTDAEVAKITELVNDINEVDKLAAEIRKDENRSIENLKKYKEAKKKAEKSATQLATLVYNKPDILKRLLSIMQLNTLGIPSLINNPLFNIFNQATVRFPVGLQVSALDQIIYGASKVGNKLFGTDVILPENNVIASQREFIRKLFQGTSESGSQLVNGLTNRDYFQKEVYASQIQPFTSAQDLWDWKFKGKKLTASQLADKSIQATIGFPAEVVARLLNIGDKPQRFAAEGAKAAVLAKQLGLSEVDYEYFLEFPKEEAYRSYKEQGMSDEAAMEKAEKTKEAIVKAGEESVFQQDNFLNDAINSVFEQSKKYGNVPYGLAQAVKMLNFPYLKIPLNAFWSVYNLVNPEVAFTQSAYYSLKAIKTKDRADIQKAKMWAAHGTTGMALLAIVGGLVAKGIVNADNDDETTKKERMGEKQYEQQKSINISKLNALIQGKDPDKVKNGLNVDLKYFGNMGNIMNTVAIRQENMTPEQKAQGADYMNELFSNLSQSSLELIDNGVFSNVSSLVTAFDRGGNYMDNYLLNLINMTTNIVQPAMFAQMSRAQLPYYSKVKADSFYEELKNNVLARSSVARELTGKYPPAQIGIWGDKLERKDDFLLKWFGMSRVNKDNFAQPIYEDYKRTKNTEFLPPSIKPLINKTKLNVKQAEELETLVGQSRKALIAPYINNLAILEGFDKKYSNLSDAEKLTALDILYSEGFKKGKNDFLAKYPQLSTQKTGFPTDEEIDRDIKKALFKLEIELKGMKE